ncbi:hypothetical protein UCRPC4_g04532 [Phaeomoniella chlamydospora]|uniref:Uncharacterized protein n=1 Tax=Phaeomoniella chlamydospora TaxID=158046 RepID=A0A0G2E8S3_PHACM|nr:hypothetical protein UCRPC4_g04532 [Phaeomoniella chlamydospora]
MASATDIAVTRTQKRKRGSTAEKDAEDSAGLQGNSSSYHESEGDDDDETSSSGASSINEDRSDDDSEDGLSTSSEQVVHLSPATSKPGIRPLPQSDLRSRLSSFLPQLRDANAAWERGEAVPRLDHVPDDEENYIEMNLGLGVLKQVKEPSDGIKTTLTDDDSSSDAESEGSELEDAVQKALKTGNSGPGIEEVKS